MQTVVMDHDIDVAALSAQGDLLFAEVNALRTADPIYRSKKSQCWVVTGHAELAEGFSGSLPLSNHTFPDGLFRVLPEAELRARIPNSITYISPWLNNNDGPAHMRQRRLLLKALSRKLVEDLRPSVQARVKQLLDKAAERGTLEFNEEIARLLPGSVILSLFGMSQEHVTRLKGWADSVATALASFFPELHWLDALEDAVTDMITMFRVEIEKRRAEPSNDLIGALVSASESGDQLSNEEVLGLLILIIIAGHDTTSNSMTLGIRALARHPDAWAQWREQPERGVDFSIELMRYIAMSAALPRIVAADFEWHGRSLKKGELVMMMIAGGNRDPLVFEHPEALDFSRRNDAAMTFAPGMHHCVGHLLAKLQMSEFFGALTSRFAGVEIMQEPEFMPALVFRGVKGLNVRFY
jgi:pimeloyl-[acyl-carrier protein] synthase